MKIIQNQHMSLNEYTKIFSGSFIIVRLILDHLENAGINAIVKDESESGRLAGFASSMEGLQEVYVSQEELYKAIPIVATVKSQLGI